MWSECLYLSNSCVLILKPNCYHCSIMLNLQPGLPGDPGDANVGPKGFKGAQGPEGDIGETGVAGKPGLDGFQGENGLVYALVCRGLWSLL